MMQHNSAKAVIPGTTSNKARLVYQVIYSNQQRLSNFVEANKLLHLYFRTEQTR
jgi:hypothetical protein